MSAAWVEIAVIISAFVLGHLFHRKLIDLSGARKWPKSKAAWRPDRSDGVVSHDRPRALRRH